MISPADAASLGSHDLLSIFNTQPGATLLLSPAWVILGASDDYLAATLTERDTLVGQYIFDAFPDNPDTPEANGVANVRASLEAVLATRQPHDMAPQHYDVPDRARPGHFVERHWKPRHTPVLDADGQVRFIIQSVQDITATRVAERLLRESQAAEQAARADAEQQRAELRRIFHEAPVAMGLLRGPDFVVEWANPRMGQIWGRPVAQVQGQPHFEALPDLAGQGFEEVFADVLATGTTRTFHERTVRIAQDQQPYQGYFNITFQPVYDGPQRITGILAYAVEVTEQVRIRQQVEQLNQELEARVQESTRQVHAQSQRLERLFMQAPAAICVLAGPELVYELANPIYQQFFPDRQLLGQPLLAALPELADHAAYHTIQQVFQTGETNRQDALHTLLARADDGVLEDRYWSYVQQPRHDEQGRVDGVLIFGYEVTESVQARQRAEALQAQVLAAAQHQAQEREAFHNVFEQTPALIALLRSPGHRYEYVNPAYQHLFPARQLVGLNVAEAVPELQQQGFVELLDRVYRSGESYFGAEVPFAVTAPGEEPRTGYFNFTYQAYREAGAVAGVSIFAFDVTEQVLARQQREAERQQLHSLFMEAPAPIVILDGPELVYQLVNPAYQRIFPGRALLGKPLLEALPEMAGIPLLHDLQRAYETGETLVAHELPLRLARTEGGPLEEIYWTFTYQARRNAQGNIDGVLVFAHEVTDQVQARRVVEARETSFQRLADHVPGSLWVTDPAGACTYLNARWYAITGQTQAEGLGLGWTHAVHPDDAAGAGATFLAANDRREPFSCLFRLRQRDGEYRWVTDQGLPRFDDTGAYEGMVGAVVDVHEQKLAELALQRLSAELGTTNEQLTRTNVDLDNFIYTASHDLKAPIANIEGLLYLLREELPPAVTQAGEVGPTLARMLDAVERFKRTIDHLTEVSKLQKENAPATTLINLAAVVEDVRQDLLPLIQASGAKLFIDVAALPPVQFTEKNLRSIVYNLLSNALKYHSPDRTPHVDVRAHVRDGHTVLEVHDNGLGLAEGHLAKLFGLFQRFHDHVEGTGIGLYMVKRMVENGGGRLEVHSQLGAGTTFFVFLPHAASAGAASFPEFVRS